MSQFSTKETRKTVVVLTGDELRHRYFRAKLVADARFDVLKVFCESDDKSLAARTMADPNAGPTQRLHVAARDQSERDFFAGSLAGADRRVDVHIPKGSINSSEVTETISALNPDVIVCYGSSIIRSALLDQFKGRFVNLHLGLSPYYRGSGTNVWPLVNQEPDMVGVTFMHIDAGVDTGAVIHQIRADLFLGDGPHSIGNRLIAKMTATCAQLITQFDRLTPQEQIHAKSRVYRQADWTEEATQKLYNNFREGMIDDVVSGTHKLHAKRIIINQGLALP
jgi:methionyl-tRNA formyltransferase